jgi:hypothetical protein
MEEKGKAFFLICIYIQHKWILLRISPQPRWSFCSSLVVHCPKWHEFLAAVLLRTRVFRQITLLPALQRIFVLSFLDQAKVKPFLDRPLGLQEVEAAWISRHEEGKIVSPTYRLPGFLHYRQMKVVRLSALSNVCLYPPGDTPGAHLCER